MTSFPLEELVLCHWQDIMLSGIVKKKKPSDRYFFHSLQWRQPYLDNRSIDDKVQNGYGYLFFWLSFILSSFLFRSLNHLLFSLSSSPLSPFLILPLFFSFPLSLLQDVWRCWLSSSTLESHGALGTFHMSPHSHYCIVQFNHFMSAVSLAKCQFN